MALVFCKCTLNKLKDFPIINLVIQISHTLERWFLKNFSSSGLVGTYIQSVLRHNHLFNWTPSANSEFPRWCPVALLLSKGEWVKMAHGVVCQENQTHQDIRNKTNLFNWDSVIMNLLSPSIFLGKNWIRAQAEFFQATTLWGLVQTKGSTKMIQMNSSKVLNLLFPKLPPPAQGHLRKQKCHSLELHFSTRKRIQHIISSPFNKYFER